MKDIIKKILNEQNNRLPFKFHEGGYLIPTNKQEGTEWLTQEEFDKMRMLNDNMKELYELEVEKLNLQKKHNKGVMYKVIDKIKSDPNFKFKTKK